MMRMTSGKTGTSHCLSSLMGQIAYRDEVVSFAVPTWATLGPGSTHRKRYRSFTRYHAISCSRPTTRSLEAIAGVRFAGVISLDSTEVRELDAPRRAAHYYWNSSQVAHE